MWKGKKIFKQRISEIKKTPKEVIEEEGWEIKKNETCCPDCVNEREYAKKKEQGIFDALCYEQFEKQCNGQKQETRKLYLLKIANKIQQIAKEDIILQDDEKLKLELYCLVHKITSIQ